MRQPTKLLEKHVSAQVRDFLKFRQWRSVRTQFAFAPGSFQTGEPGMADYLFLRYLENGLALALWIELKGPNDQRKCRCEVDKVCKLCRQTAWQERERVRGARVWVVSNIEDFERQYYAEFGWLHSDAGIGQMDLLLMAGVRGGAVLKRAQK